MEPSHAQSPSRRVKLLFWLVLGLFSTAFAEVTCNNELFAFFTLSGYIVIIPVYLLHVLLLTTVVVRWGRPVWPVPYMVGEFPRRSRGGRGNSPPGRVKRNITRPYTGM